MPTQNPSDTSGDILSQLTGKEQRDINMQNRYLRSIDESLKQIIQDGRMLSQSNAVNAYGSSDRGFSYRNPRYSNMRGRSSSIYNTDDDLDLSTIKSGITSEIAQSIVRSRGLKGIFNSVIHNLTDPITRSVSSSVYDLLDGIEHAIKEGADQSKFKKKLKDSLDSLAKDLGVETKDIKKALGRELGKKLLGNSDMKAITDFWKNYSNSSIENAKAQYQKAIDETTIGETRKQIESEIARQQEEFGIKSSTESDEVQTDIHEQIKKQQELLASLKQKLTAGQSESKEFTSDASRESKDVNKPESSVKSTEQHDNESSPNSSEVINPLINDIRIYTESINYNISNIASILGDYINSVDQTGIDESTLTDISESQAQNVPEIQNIIENEAPVIPSIEQSEIIVNPAEVNPPDVVVSNIDIPEINQATKGEFVSREVEMPDESELSHVQNKGNDAPFVEPINSGDTNSILSESELNAESEKHNELQVERSGVSDVSDVIDAIEFAQKELEALAKTLEFEENNQASKDELSEASAKATANVAKEILSKAENIVGSNSTLSKVLNLAKSSGKGLFGGIIDDAKSAFSEGKSKFLSESEKVISGKMDPTEMSGINGMIHTFTQDAVESGAVTAESAATAGAAMSGLTNVITNLSPEVLLAKVGFSLVTSTLKKAFKPALDGAKKTIDAAEAAISRFHTSNLKNIENSQKRLIADINTLVQTPFDLLRKGAEEWYNAWDNNLRTITATQGYTKSDLQNLMASFADRLRNEGLTSVVSATDITNNLTKVLESGLSGDIAEEFAYIATKLNAAVPTQDFFSYADTYASIAANAVRTGMNQAEAIEYANQQLTAFANNVLYASREVAGGFTTGLKNAESLFKQSVQIAQTGRSYNASEISGVLTAVSAITGAIAPDLASAMTDAIYKASVGGNSSELLALRAITGENASQTEFLKEITENPKKVFSELFRELSKRQNMSEDAYMEVAEEMSKIFGLSAEFFARVDFGYLAQAIESMDTSSKALTENMLLLASGETTTNAEQLKMQQINQQILDEGLSYVLDNEAARAIQQHMWDEQLARELQETEYSVSLRGAALELLEGIRSAVETIGTILNPVKLLGKIASLFASSKEDEALQADVSQVLELGKVGQGNALSRYNLVTYNSDLNVVDDLNTLMGGTSSYKKQHARTEFWTQNDLFTGVTSSAIYNSMNQGEYTGSTTVEGANAAPTSKFKWDTVGKSAVYDLLNTSQSNVELKGIEGIKKSESEVTESTMDTATAENMQRMLDAMQDYVNNNPEATFIDFLDTARSYGISDFDQVLKDTGLTADQVRAQYDLYQAQIGAKQEKKRSQREEEYWDKTEEAVTNTSVSLGSLGEYADELHKSLTKSGDLYTIFEGLKNNSDTLTKSLTPNGDLFTRFEELLGYSKNISDYLSDEGNIYKKIEGINTSVSNVIRNDKDVDERGRLLESRSLTSIYKMLETVGKGTISKDDNREHATGFELTATEWLKWIYYQLAGTNEDQTQGILEKIAENIGSISASTENSNSGSADLAHLASVLSDLSKILKMFTGGSDNGESNNGGGGTSSSGYKNTLFSMATGARFL